MWTSLLSNWTVTRGDQTDSGAICPWRTVDWTAIRTISCPIQGTVQDLQLLYRGMHMWLARNGTGHWGEHHSDDDGLHCWADSPTALWSLSLALALLYTFSADCGWTICPWQLEVLNGSHWNPLSMEQWHDLRAGTVCTEFWALLRLSCTDVTGRGLVGQLVLTVSQGRMITLNPLKSRFSQGTVKTEPGTDMLYTFNATGRWWWWRHW